MRRWLHTDHVPWMASNDPLTSNGRVQSVLASEPADKQTKGMYFERINESNASENYLKLIVLILFVLNVFDIILLT